MRAVFQTPTPDLQKSLAFYQKLNFKILSEETTGVVADDKMVLEINPDRYARAGVKLYKEDWSAVVKSLESISKTVQTDDGFVLSDFSGSWIYLINGNGTDYTKSDSPSVLGQNFGLTLETTNMDLSCKIWEALGFECTQGSAEKGWVTYSHGEIGVSIMAPHQCPHLFFNPSISFFNGSDNMKVIDKIRSLDIPISEEITHFNKTGEVDNIIVRDPGGFGFFIFND